MFTLDVLFEADRFVVKSGPVETANETSILQNQLFLLFLTPQVSERIDNDTENQIQNDNDDDEEE